MGVIDAHLKKHHLKWLVADAENPEGKASYADISFVPWGMGAAVVAGKDIFAEGAYGAYKAWMDRVCARPAVKEALEEKAGLAGK